MKVLQLGPFPPPQGGVQVNIVDIREYLRARGHRAPVINLTRHRREDADDVYYPHSPAGVMRRLLHLRPDVIHLHVGGDIRMRLLALGAFCATLPGARAVLTFHSGGFPTSERGRAMRRGSMAARLLRRFHHIVAVNEEIREFLVRQCGVEPSRVSVICPYAEPAVSGEPLPATLEEFAQTHSPLLATVGLLEPEYALEMQIDTLGKVRARHPRAGLVIIGSGSLEAALRQRAAAAPYAQHVLIAGDAPHQATVSAIARADLFLRTTWYDGDAVSVREALSVGTPVIATRTAFRPPGPLLVPVNDADALEAAILGKLAEPGAPRAAPSPARGVSNIAAVVRVYEALRRS